MSGREGVLRWFATDPPREVGHWEERVYCELGSGEKKTSLYRTPIAAGDHMGGAVYHDRPLTDVDFAALTRVVRPT